MAATGGGKIRARRYHIASKPYIKNKQGIISRVTDTVKNIVPGWLQRYFKQNIDNVPPEEEKGGRETAVLEQNEENDQSYTDEESQVFTDGRNTPEPMPGNNVDGR
ncbi:nuclear pore complex protein Nup153-like [Protopterus annectens]|uniref:nuclear pore complex protein Nup153-like n=1 Tax=Protopterus annectens TaxID=7888 RepID=UPI001CFB32CA|nr:nuclear pore complex protein Nup153-like [Protopterus annectens]